MREKREEGIPMDDSHSVSLEIGTSNATKGMEFLAPTKGLSLFTLECHCRFMLPFFFSLPFITIMVRYKNNLYLLYFYYILYFCSNLKKIYDLKKEIQISILLEVCDMVMREIRLVGHFPFHEAKLWLFMEKRQE